MRNQRIKAARDVATRLFAFEDAIDHALACGGDLAAALPAARKEAGLSATVGQDAIDSVVAAIGKIARARREIVSGHFHLDTTKTQIGLRETAFGDSVKITQADSGLTVVPDTRAA
jgi:hypothetical protein